MIVSTKVVNTARMTSCVRLHGSKVVFLASALACCLRLSCLSLVDASRESPSVAVVGAGIGGSTASYFLRELLGDGEAAKIVVFDRAEKAGGRTDVRRCTSAHSSEVEGARTSLNAVLHLGREFSCPVRACRSSAPVP